MDKICGNLTEVGTWNESKIDVIRIGSTKLKGSRCVPPLAERLVPGRDVCLYIYRHLFYKPVILGIKYQDTGEKFLMPSFMCRNSCLQLLVLYGIGWIIGTLIVGGMIVGSLGGNPETSGGVFALIGLAIAVYLTARFWLDYRAAQAD